MFSIKITKAHANWIHIELEIGGARQVLMASSVLNDPLRELADLGVFIATREPGNLGARFWLEPNGLELRASWRQADLVLALYEADEAYPELRQPRLALEGVVDANEAARELLRCLNAARSLLTREQWRHDFPAERVSVLADAIAVRS